MRQKELLTWVYRLCARLPDGDPVREEALEWLESWIDKSNTTSAACPSFPTAIESSGLIVTSITKVSGLGNGSRRSPAIPTKLASGVLPTRPERLVS